MRALARARQKRQTEQCRVRAHRRRAKPLGPSGRSANESGKRSWQSKKASVPVAAPRVT